MSKKKARTPPTPDTLRELSGHISYECDMLILTATKLLEHKPADEVMHNALVESFLIHARQLYQFFYWDEPWKDTDAVAIDYLATWRGDRPKEPTVLRELSDIVGMKVAHVTVMRLKKEDYRIRDAGCALLEVIDAFLEKEPETYETKPKASLAPDWADPHRAFKFSGEGVITTTSQTSGSVLIRADGTEPLKTSRRTD